MRSLVDRVVAAEIGSSWPLLPISSCNTIFAQNNIKRRSAKIWNSLPRGWIMKDMTYNKFVDDCKEWLVKRRENEFVYF